MNEPWPDCENCGDEMHRCSACGVVHCNDCDECDPVDLERESEARQMQIGWDGEDK